MYVLQIVVRFDLWRRQVDIKKFDSFMAAWYYTTSSYLVGHKITSAHLDEDRELGKIIAEIRGNVETYYIGLKTSLNEVIDI